MFGPYELRSLLGRGGMGEVHRAFDTRMGRLVALKRLPSGVVDDVDFRRRFLREAELTARLRNSHVIPIHHYGEIDGKLFLDMRLVDGTDLAAHLEGYGPLTPENAVAVLSQVAQALDEAHGVGLVHRDIKPQNVLLERSDSDPAHLDDAPGRVYLIDFGIAANLSATQVSAAIGTGTAAYMAPERFSTTGDRRVDVYALGCVLHELLTGARPFEGDHVQLMWAHVRKTPPRPSDRRAGLPRGLDDVVAVAMAKDPEHRYETAGAFAQAARAAVDAASTPSRRSFGLRRRRRLRSRRRRLVLATAALVTVVAAVATVVVTLRPETPGTDLAGFVVDGGPGELLLSRDGRTLYVSDLNDGTLSVVDTGTNTVRQRVPVGPSPTRMALTVDGRNLIVVHEIGNPTVSVVDTRRNVVTSTIPLGTGGRGVTVSADGRRAFVTRDGTGDNAPASSVAIVGLPEARVLGDIPVGQGPDDIKSTPQREDRIFVTNYLPGTLSIIDATTNTVVSSPRVGAGPRGLAVSPDGTRVYVANAADGANSVSVFDTATSRVTSIPVGARPNAVAFSPDGAQAYSSNADSGSVSQIDVASGRVQATFPAGIGVSAVAVSNDGSRLYAANYDANSVSVIATGL